MGAKSWRAGALMAANVCPPDPAKSIVGGSANKVQIKLVRLKVRADFLRVAQGSKWSAPGLVLQMRRSETAGALPRIRVGFTATKKIGGAVERNRTKRRLRAAAAAIMPLYGKPGHDYVLVGRAGTNKRPFALILQDLVSALRKVHQRPQQKATS
jgi:ribonuclease P protein component